jgi:hypothetical protein
MIGYHGCSAQQGMKAAGALCALVLGLTVMCSAAEASDPEIRHFVVSIDKKLAGHYTMTISGETMEAHANVDVRFYLVGHYAYKYDGTEKWKDDRLQTLASKCNDSGARYTVQAQVQPDANGLVVWTNGKQRTRQNDVWTTTYWRLPTYIKAQPGARQSVKLLDADTGNDLAGTLEYMGLQQVNVAGNLQNCEYYRLAGEKLDVKLWYDSSRRLVREESVEGKDSYILELKRIR